jgi:hypothetical protein
MKVRDRIKELRRVPASELIPNPKNWRTHPVSQKQALKGVLAEIGYADALIARETPDGLMLIDGHLRAETTPDSEVPVLVLDINEEEADLMLATLDPLAAMAESDDQSLRTLVNNLEIESVSVHEMLEGILEPLEESGNGSENTVDVLFDQSIQLKPQREYIVVVCDTDAEFALLREHLQLKTVRRGGYRKRTTKTKDEVGVERVIEARRLLDACSNTE